MSEYMDHYLQEGVVTDKYIPVREMSFKVKGVRSMGLDKFLQGYLFVETEEPDRLYQELKRILGMPQILTDGEKFLPSAR